MSTPVTLRPGPDFAPAVLGDLLRYHAQHRAEKPFLTCGADSKTYGEMNERTDRVAAGFAALGVGKGDRVAILSPNRFEMFELQFGLAKLGAIQVPLNAYLKGEFLRYQIADCGASAVVTDRAGAIALAPLLPELPDLRAIVQLDAVAPDDTEQTVAYSAVRACPQDPPQVVVRPDDLMSILYTSGTTGLPKGCMLPHGYDVRVGELVATAMEQGEDDITISALPAFHAITRMMVVTAALTRGSSVVIEEAFHASTFLARAAEVGATLAAGVGTTGVAILATPPSPADRAHRLRTMMLGPFTPEQQQQFHQRFGIDAWTEIFGQTECVGLLWSPVSGPRRRSTVGCASPDLEVAVLDDDGNTVPDGETGEISLRPRHRFALFSGYWGKPAATLEAFSGLWYHTGDFGRRDRDGFFTFVDRKKDAIRRRGENISSFEVETAIAGHPDIAEVAIHGVPTGSLEDEVMAVIAPRPGTTLDPAELFDFLTRHLPYFAVPRYVRIVNAIPRNAVQRVMKFRLRELPIDDSVWDFEKLALTVARQDRR